MYKTILVPLDGSKRAEQILPHIEELGKRFDAKIILLQVVEQPKVISEGSAAHYIKDLEKMKMEADTYLSKLAEKFQKMKIQTETRVEHWQVVEAIIRIAEREKVDLIAIASHGRGGVSRVFYGSVAASLLHRVDRPLLLIRSRDE